MPEDSGSRHPSRLAAGCRVALAGLLHDLGKLGERAGLTVDAAMLEKNVHQYSPYHQTHAKDRGWFSHKHAAYTALAFDRIEAWLPKVRGAVETTPFGEAVDDSLINAAARLLTLFEQIRLDGGKEPAVFRYRYRYRLEPMTPAALFPVAADGYEAFLLRVGRHSGAESVTLNGVRSIKILLGKDSETGKMRSENRATGTSWWLAADDIQAKTGMLPFGWLLVECYPGSGNESISRRKVSPGGKLRNRLNRQRQCLKRN